MDLKTYILPGYKITLDEGHYQGIEALEEEIDEVQTYDMTPEEFDSNTISLNKQTITKVTSIREIKIKTKDLIKIEFADDDLYKFGNVFIINKDCAVMGGSSLGWLVGDLQGILDELPEDASEGDIIEKYTQMEAGQKISIDDEKDLRDKEIISVEKIEDTEEEQTVYWIDHLENGDSVFINDIMVGVRRQDVKFGEDED